MKLIVGNWKMNLSLAQAKNLASEVKNIKQNRNEIVLCPPFVFLQSISEIISNSHIHLGSQDCHYLGSGAFTGDISPIMLKEFSVQYVILGHSERRQYHFENDDLVNKKANFAIQNGLIPIICVGENLTEREANNHKEIVSKQLEISTKNLNGKFVIAYEPVWAIGTGKTAQKAEILEMHQFIKSKFPSIKILYGGSVNENNYSEILNINSVDGLLIGGASIDFQKFSKICHF
ncbi:MAG: triose-phosphate isomerase [Rickettsiales bacterium]|nr:triose-phosphate isomerase [Rickettsiales bacterium]